MPEVDLQVFAVRCESDRAWVLHDRNPDMTSFVAGMAGHGSMFILGQVRQPVALMTMRRLLVETAGLAADYLEGTPERPVGGSAERARAPLEPGWAVAGDAVRPAGGDRPPRGGSRPRPGRELGRALLRLRDRRSGAGGARSRLAHVDVGSERGAVCDRAVGGGGGGGCGGLDG